MPTTSIRSYQLKIMATLTDVAPVSLNNDEILRYSRHLIMPEVGMEGQLKLKAAKVLCIGAGGLGSPLALYLGAAGVGTLGLVDFDVVDYTNLQRQIIHRTEDVGRPKLDSAVDKLKAMNPFLNIKKFNTHLSSDNALEIFQEFDIIADGTDNFPTRYLTNDACVLSGKPNVYASIFRFEGQASVFGMPDGPCYRCLYPEPPPPGLVPSCAEGGVLGILPGLLGVIQATEVIKLILGSGDPLIGRLLLVDALGMKFRELKLRKNPNCPVCGKNPTLKKLIDYQEFCGIRGEEAPAEVTTSEMQVEELKQRLDRGEDLYILDVREPHEYQICNLGGHLIPLGDLPRRVNELGRQVSRRSTTSREEFWPGQTGSIPACRSTESSSGFLAVRLQPDHTTEFSSLSRTNSSPAFLFYARRACKFVDSLDPCATCS
jgi:sulfur-carrier protein adenylyltransferase/sulfurtransferase